MINCKRRAHKLADTRALFQALKRKREKEKRKREKEKREKETEEEEEKEKQKEKKKKEKEKEKSLNITKEDLWTLQKVSRKGSLSAA